MAKAPGKSHCNGISLIELTEMFPIEEGAIKWFESVRWPEGRSCPHCGNCDTSEVPNKKPMPYWCGACRSYFSVKTGTSIQSSRLPMRKWVFAVYLYVTNLKSVSSMKLHRDLKVTQKTAWFMLHRLRDAWMESGLDTFTGPAEADETYIGGKRKTCRTPSAGNSRAEVPQARRSWICRMGRGLRRSGRRHRTARQIAAPRCRRSDGRRKLQAARP